MADQIMTTGGALTAITPEVWSTRLYDVLLAELPFNGSVDRSYEGDIQDLGDTVNISSVPEFEEANELAEGAKSDAESVTITGQQLVINKRIVKDFIITRKAQIQSIDVMDKLREHAIYSILKKMHSNIISIIAPSTSAPDHTIGFDSSTTLGLADILEAKELLDNSNVSKAERVFVAGVAQYNDLFNLSGFTSRDFIPSGSPLTSGDIATPVLGFTPKMTSELGNVVYFFHPSFLTLAIQDQMRINVYDLGGEGIRAYRVNVDLLMGQKQLDNKRVVQMS